MFRDWKKVIVVPLNLLFFFLSILNIQTSFNYVSSSFDVVLDILTISLSQSLSSGSSLIFFFFLLIQKYFMVKVCHNSIRDKLIRWMLWPKANYNFFSHFRTKWTLQFFLMTTFLRTVWLWRLETWLEELEEQNLNISIFLLPDHGFLGEPWFGGFWGNKHLLLYILFILKIDWSGRN